MSEEKNRSNSELEKAGETISAFANTAFSAGLKFMNRVVQKTEVALGTSEATPIDQTTEELLARSESVRSCISDLIDRIEAFIEPDPLKKGATKLMSMVGPSSKIPSSVTQIKEISDCMFTHAQKLPTNTTFWQALTSCGTSFKETAMKQHELVTEMGTKVLTPLHSMMDNEYRIITNTKDRLMNTRLDLDSLKNKQRRNYEDVSLNAECRKLNSDFDMIKIELQSQLDDFCGAQGQAKLSFILNNLTEILKN
ncbi:hypothetical protein HZS_455, partial [Henneguya salminicola]